MKKYTIGILMFLFISLSLNAQDALSIYATMDATNAAEFQDLFPDQIEILDANNNQAAVYLSESATHKLHDMVETHGPGYMFRASAEKALQAIENTLDRPESFANFSITEDVLVNQCLNLVDGNNIENDILLMEGYGTRYHTKPQAEQSVFDLQARWDVLIQAAGRTDVHTRIVNHVNTPMPSVVLTMDGANTPDEFVIIGGHIDSTAWPSNNDAPGADDNASGIASLTEMIRVLLDVDFVPNRTIEVMAYAAEEIGLVGSAEIAEEYANNGVDVIAYVQFDMTGYKGSSEDVYITTDSYNSASLNSYLMDLMDHYNAAGIHGFTYGTSICNYGCSDHFSWADNGYDAAFPFEAELGEDNPNIHSPNDVYSFFNTSDHSVKFAKLGLEFLVEVAKPEVLSVGDFSENAISIYTKDKQLNFRLENTVSDVKNVNIYNVAGQKIISETLEGQAGSISLQQFASGFYIVQFTLENNHVLTKKVVLN